MKYIFGYGSLLFPHGINGRRMKRIYTEADLTEAWLFGYKREWNACWHPSKDQPGSGTRYLGLTAASDQRVNGVIFPLDDADFEAFAISEGCGPEEEPLYTFDNVRTQIGIDPEADLVLTPDDLVLTCVTRQPSLDGTVAKYYIDIIDSAVKSRGVGFAAEFWSQTAQPK